MWFIKRAQKAFLFFVSTQGVLAILVLAFLFPGAAFASAPENANSTMSSASGQSIQEQDLEARLNALAHSTSILVSALNGILLSISEALPQLANQNASWGVSVDHGVSQSDLLASENRLRTLIALQSDSNMSTVASGNSVTNQVASASLSPSSDSSSSSSPWVVSGSNISYTAGNVGIGTSTPSQRLTVGGNAEITGTVTADDLITKGPWVDVRAFGAKGDGTTDDTAAFNAAIASLGTAGGTIYVPNGEWAVNLVITQDNIHILGESSGEYNTPNKLVPYDTSKPVIQVGNDTGLVVNFRLENIGMEGSGPNGTGSTGLYLAGGAYRDFYNNIDIRDFLDYGLRLEAGTSQPVAYNFFSGLVVEANTVSTNGVAVGIYYPVSGSYTAANYFTNVNISGPATNGYALEVDSATPNFANTWIQAENSHGIKLDMSTGQAPLISASNVTVDSDNSSDVLVTGFDTGALTSYMVGSYGVDGKYELSNGTTVQVSGTSHLGYQSDLVDPFVRGGLSFGNGNDAWNQDQQIYTASGQLWLESTGNLRFDTGTSSASYFNSPVNISGGLTIDGNLNLASSTEVLAIGGQDALYVPDQASFYGSLFIGGGGESLSHMTGSDGQSNLGMGIGALSSVTTGNENVAIGTSALHDNTTGATNLALGTGALQSNITGNDNVALGTGALTNSTDGTANLALGSYALGHTTDGVENTGLGYEALLNNTWGSYNSAFGSSALYNAINAATKNVAMGYKAGYNITTGSNNIFIGSETNAADPTANYQLNIGNTIYGDLSTGNIGIDTGTTTPAYPLVVNGQAYITGKVGIGTTPDTLSNPNTQLKVVASDNTAEFQADLANSAGSGRAFSVGVPTESYDRAIFYSNGAFGVGSGNSTRDIFLSRSSANTFQIAGSFDGTTPGNLQVTGNIGIGTTTPFAKLTVASGNIAAANGAICADNGGGTKCQGTLTAGVVYGDSSSFTASDLAENYPVNDHSLEAGDVVAIDQDGKLVKAGSEEAQRILGIVSTAPGVLLGDETGTSTRPVALSGRVPVKFSNTNGEVKPGDLLTLSSTTPGIAVKATSTGTILGTALEDSNGTDTVMMFVHVSWVPSVHLSEAEADALVTSANKENQNFFARTASFVTDSMKAVVGYFKSIFADDVHVKDELCVGDTCVNESQLKILLENAHVSQTSVASQTSEASQTSKTLATTTPDGDSEKSETAASSSDAEIKAASGGDDLTEESTENKPSDVDTGSGTDENIVTNATVPDTTISLDQTTTTQKDTETLQSGNSDQTDPSDVSAKGETAPLNSSL
ncbi:MAG TPA: glycosyl hydrolase family 28-related protein [Candidatus Paceibacterota bacterium]|nr:glycosyl hydrolase family 28-related protein [Candidatus Paceibacterota bacterium]